MKKGLLIIILIIIVSCTVKPKTIDQYQESIDYSCNKDSECEIKDIRNCCGYFPQCANSNFSPNPELVKELCKNQNEFSICGFQEIKNCKCVEKKCEQQN